MKRKKQIIPPFTSFLLYLLEEQLVKQKVTKSKIGPSLRNGVERNIPETENGTVQFRIITAFLKFK